MVSLPKCEPLHTGAAKTGVSIFQYLAFISVSVTNTKRYAGRKRALIGRSATVVTDVLSSLSDYRHRRTRYDTTKQAAHDRLWFGRPMNKT